MSAQNQRIALDYVAGPTCPARSEFIAQVRARTRLADFADDSGLERRFSVSVAVRAGRFVGSLSSPSSGFPTERQVSSDNCVDVISALALIAALAIDPHADLMDAPTRTADDPTPPAASAISTATVPDQTERSTGSVIAAPQSGRPIATGQAVLRIPAAFDRTPSTIAAHVATNPYVPRPGRDQVPDWLLGAGIEGAFWPSSPGVFWGGMSLVLERQFPSRSSLLSALRFSIAHSRSAVHRAGTGAARFVQNVVAVDVCPFALRWSALVVQGCVGAEGGMLAATGLAEDPIVSAWRHNRPWWALHEQVELIIGLNRDWATILNVGIAEPLWRDHFVFDFPSASSSATQTDLLRTPAWSTRVALQLGRRF